MVLGNGFLGKCFGRNGFRTYGRDKLGSVYDMMMHPYRLTEMDEFNNAKYIVNCIGISDTRFCEERRNWQDVLEVNGVFPGFLSDVCRNYNKKLIHISTGCLYEGTNGKKKETDPVETHCNYTLSKHVGELGCDINNDLILRPRLLFDCTHSEKNLLTKFKRIKFFLNEFNTITSNQTILDSTIMLIKNDCAGVYNVGNTGTYTIYEMAKVFCETQNINIYGTIQQDDLIESQGLHLVNNVMDMSKLINDTKYIPGDALDTIRVYALWLN